MQKIFKPLFKELEIIKQPLDKDEFIDAATRLYEVKFLFIICLLIYFTNKIDNIYVLNKDNRAKREKYDSKIQHRQATRLLSGEMHICSKNKYK